MVRHSLNKTNCMVFDLHGRIVAAPSLIPHPFRRAPKTNCFGLEPKSISHASCKADVQRLLPVDNHFQTVAVADHSYRHFNVWSNVSSETINNVEVII